MTRVLIPVAGTVPGVNADIWVDEDDPRAQAFFASNGFDPNQPRDRTGKWRKVGVPSIDTLPRGPENALGYRPIKVGDDLDLAVKLLSEGEPIELDQPEEAATLIDRVGEIAKRMRERGEKEPVFDLCKVSVPNTNLFCHDSVGLPRIEMPQLKGEPLPGSEADKLPRDRWGDVDLGPAFRDYLESRGVKFEQTEVPSEDLKATQNELSGAKVSDLLDFAEKGEFEPGSYFVSHDNYILDGHHRWATQVALDLEDNEPGDVMSEVERADIGIGSLLFEALKFAEEKGIPQAGVANPLKQTAMAADWNPVDHPRDRKGRFRKTGVGGGTPSVSAKEVNEAADRIDYTWGNVDAKWKSPTNPFTLAERKRIREQTRKAIGEAILKYPQIEKPSGPPIEIHGPPDPDKTSMRAPEMKFTHLTAGTELDPLDMLDMTMGGALLTTSFDRVTGDIHLEINDFTEELADPKHPNAIEKPFLSPAGRDPYGRALHEMGHVVARVSNLTDDQIAEAMERAGLMVPADEFEGTYRRQALPHPGDPRWLKPSKMLEDLSLYAGTRPPEAFGELFAMLNRSDDNPWDGREIDPVARGRADYALAKFRDEMNKIAGQKVV